jgi:hypothetical protein
MKTLLLTALSIIIIMLMSLTPKRRVIQRIR